MSKLADQYYKVKNDFWSIPRLIELSKDLEIFEIPMKCLNIFNLYPKATNTKEFVDHVRDVINADMSYPIILDDEGYVMDGRHRIMKALLEGYETIKAVRFDKTPSCCFTDNTES